MRIEIDFHKWDYSMDYRMRFSQRRRQIVVVWYVVQKRLKRNMCMCYVCRMQDGGDNSSAWRNYVSSSDTVAHSSLRGLEARSVCILGVIFRMATAAGHSFNDSHI